MKKFEYYILKNSEIERMNYLGESGWELVCVDTDFLYFKREIKPLTHA